MILATLLFIALRASELQGSDTSQIKTAFEQTNAAYEKGNLSLAFSYLAPDGVHIEADGSKKTRAEYVSAISEFFNHAHGTKVRWHIDSIKVKAQTATLHASRTLDAVYEKGKVRKKYHTELVESQNWIKSRGKWLIHVARV